MRAPLFVILLLAITASACSHSVEEKDENTNASAVIAVPDTVELRYEPRFVLDRVLEQKNRAFDPAKPFPRIRLASEIALVEFQDAIESQWGFRPDVITNAYSVATNTIYLMDDAPYYAAHGRCIDDSLAHEFTHYVQVVYQGWQLDAADDSIEMDAIYIQRWFRETYCAE